MWRGGWPDMPQIESNLEPACWRDELNPAFAFTGDDTYRSRRWCHADRLRQSAVTLPPA